jgi:predicted signal transduction protein with EAL and GGDEF domain
LQEREYRIHEIRARLLAVTALAARGKQVAAQAALDLALALADQCGAAALRRSERSLGRELQLRLGGTTRVQEQPAPADAGGRGVPGLVGELRLALRQDQFLLHYQPKLNLATGRVDAVGGLVRWQHPRLGLIFPDRFVPMAEKAGLIGGITHWVLAAGLEQSRDWRERGLQIKVSVNISASDISDPRFAEVVETTLERAVFEPGLLCLEVTESEIMNRPDRALATLDALKAIGVALSIDDFGTGHSSLAYVHELPVSASGSSMSAHRVPVRRTRPGAGERLD